MKNMQIDMSHRKELLRFLKAGDSVITTSSGKEYKVSQAEAEELNDVLINTGWVTTKDFQVNPGNIASVDRDDTTRTDKKPRVSSKATGQAK